MIGQDALFYEDWRDALRHLVRALGGPKKVGGMLRPSLSALAAANWVNDCLNPARDTNFDLEELAKVLKAGRDAGVHCAIYKLCDEIGYHHPSLATPKTDYQLIVDKLERQIAELRRTADEAAAAKAATDTPNLRRA